MSGEANNTTPVAVRRVCCDARLRHGAQRDVAGGGEFQPGDAVHALRPVKNDGVYPHKDIGEVLVHPGDDGVVRERWSFLGEIYYAVEFASRSVAVIMRGRELAKRGPGS